MLVEQRSRAQSRGTVFALSEMRAASSPPMDGTGWSSTGVARRGEVDARQQSVEFKRGWRLGKLVEKLLLRVHFTVGLVEI